MRVDTVVIIAPSLEAIDARLLYDDGDTSAVIGDSGWILWNTIIGEGWAKKPSSATLISVTVAGRPERLPVPAVLQVVAEAGGRQFVREESPVASFDASGKRVVRVRLPNTGCESVTVTVRLSVHRTPLGARTLLIPFECGE